MSAAASGPPVEQGDPPPCVSDMSIGAGVPCMHRTAILLYACVTRLTGSPQLPGRKKPDSAGAAAATSHGSLIAVIGDEDTVTGMLLAGVGNVDARRTANFLVVDSKTTTGQIEEAFHRFTRRSDVAMLLINQYIATVRLASCTWPRSDSSGSCNAVQPSHLPHPSPRVTPMLSWCSTDDQANNRCLHKQGSCNLGGA